MELKPRMESRYWIGKLEECTEVFDLELGRAAVFTAASPLHPTRNEDSAAILTLPGCAIFAVADGVGGLPGGEAASADALEALGESVAEAASDPSASRIRCAIVDGFEAGHARIATSGTGATTLAAIEVRSGSLRTYHAGDSAVIVVDSRGDLRLQTVAHSPVGYAMESGLIDESDALFHANRNVIFKCLGRDLMGVEIGWPFEIDRNDTVLVATDGLLDNLTLAEIAEGLREPDLERAASDLGRLARRRMEPNGDDGKPSKPDDVAFTLFRPN